LGPLFDAHGQAAWGWRVQGQEVLDTMYAVIETGGKQYKVQKGDVLKVEKLEAQEGELVEINQVLAVVDEKKVSVGKPLVKGAKVTLKVLEHGKGDKIIVYKYKPKKNYRRKYGHRQPYSKVLVESIALNG
jgi:large subunit ribosomal protein L21